MRECEAMRTYIALLRGINVGGKNKILMPELKAAFTDVGFSDVRTYIASGNVIFSSNLGESVIQVATESLILERFGFNIPVCVISSADLREALSHAPVWWDTDPESKHNALFVISPMTTQEALALIGMVKPEYEKLDYYGKMIFWSAPIATFSRTRLTKIVQSKTAYDAITIRGSNTARKLSELAQEA